MKRTSQLLVVLLLLVGTSVAGCISQMGTDPSSQSPQVTVYPASKNSVSYEYASDEMLAGDVTSEVYISERKTITSVEMSIEVDNASRTVDDIITMTTAAGGYVSSSSVYDLSYDSTPRKEGYVTVRIPSENYTAFVKDIENLGDLSSKSITGTDVTEEYIDLEARLNNLQKQEKRLTEILNMSNTVEEVLSVEKELERVRGEIDSLTGRLQYLDNRIDLATINIRVTEPTPITHSWGMRDALSSSVQGFVSTVRAMVILVGYLLPIAIVLSVLVTIVFVIGRRVHRKR
ncbi:MAG: hypothetical protein A4E24_00669 [Methanomethylovorans sp. PtaU1.Bin093]|jgi:hypothetical protein|uniref:DUF4349 domain-containing protein n=1 Tax=Methanomethylovorans sp. PtaU1.Bin093 TaxID=1811679 RepID=UPI0009C90303|nr:DUF4349 domain-containing protein [Methanomethylovorans sp. PtaU1.Bin093]OPY21188.1 MAG: hypothetical protein A4E24_00669 [Methanomethylovorans sp. PtaU1.Bin093]